jgi:dynein heavy chain
MPFSHPNQAGVAIWSYSLLMRANRAKDAIDGLYFIQEHPSAKEAIDKYHKLKTQIDDRISKTMWDSWNKKNDMIATNERIDTALQNSLLVRQADKAGNRALDAQKDERTQALLQKQKPDLLESNFDTDLLKLFYETMYWNKIQTLGMISFPLPLTRLLARKEQLRVLRENVMLIVRDYN